MNDPVLEAIRERIQVDVNQRGLRNDVAANLCNALPHDFAAACQSIADAPAPHVALVTGFLIPTADPPAGETDGPLGAVFLARALGPLGIGVSILSDDFCMPALRRGLGDASASLHQLPRYDEAHAWNADRWRGWFHERVPNCTHLVALERVGPSCTASHLQQHLQGDTEAERLHAFFLAEVADEYRDRCQTMRGRDITASMSPVHTLFEAMTLKVHTIGIGDGGNEIGMGRMPWKVIRANIRLGGQIACRIATNHLIVAGISNWGAYGLAAGVWHLRSKTWPCELADPQRERTILQAMVDEGLVDGVTNQRTATVDGLDFDRYAALLPDLAQVLREKREPGR